MGNFTLAQLAEGVQRKSLGAESPRLLAKWGRTGLLEGLKGVNKENMARLLENQAAELLKENNTISTGGASLASSGQLAGFSNVAFPIVRRVFAGLIANEVVSVQPMSLPSGLLFYLDYTYGSMVGGDAGLTLSNASTKETYQRGDSIFNNPAGKGVRSGSLGVGGQYDLVGSGYSRVHVQSKVMSGSNADVGSWISGSTWSTGKIVASSADFTGTNSRFLNFDPQVDVDIANNVLDTVFMIISASTITSSIVGADLTSLEQVALHSLGTNGGAGAWGAGYQGGASVFNLRKLNRRGNWDGVNVFSPDALNGSHVMFAIKLSNNGAVPTIGAQISGSAAITDGLAVSSTDGSTLTIPSFESDFGSTASPTIPEVDIKIESVAVVANTRKLRARWSPEMAQDLTAFYSIDIEVELTNILSEMITLDIDREILNDLLTQASAANLYWSRAPGKFLNKQTGAEVLGSSSLSPGPLFTGTVREWYETLVETIIDVSNIIYKKTLRGSGNFIVTSPDVCTMLENSVVYKASYSIDSDGQVKDGGNMGIGSESVGQLNNRFAVHKDPYFPANKILVGLKGNTFLESGYIYAPYVPLLMTPVVYAADDFTPRKGIMTRYGKKVVRSDFYGTVTVTDMNVI